MALAVGQVVELVGPHRAGLLRHPARDVHVVAGIAIRLGRHQAQIGADHAQEVDLLLALRLRHHDDAAIAARVADQREADAGVAGGALDDGAAGLQHAALLGVGDDVEAGAILHRAARVHELGLAQDVAAGGLRGAAQPDQRRLADRRRQVLLPVRAVVELGHRHPHAAGVPVMVENVPPAKVWEALQKDPKAQLVDVRTDAEWNFVGLPDLSPAGKQVVPIQWQVYPTMAPQRRLRRPVEEAGFTAGAPHLLHLPQRPAQPRRGAGGAGGGFPARLQRRRWVRGRRRCRGPSRGGGRLEGRRPALAAAIGCGIADGGRR